MSASLLRATLDATADGILVIDRAGRVVGSNRRFAEMWRIPDALHDADDEVLLGHVVAQVEDPEAFLARVRELYASPEAESFDTLTFTDGRVFERYSRPQRLGDEVVGRVWSFRDVSTRVAAEAALRESQERLVQAQKMEVVGRLAGGVAHDFNNLLTIIGGHAQMLLDRLPPDSSNARSARDIQRAVEHAAALTGRLLAFSRKQVVLPRVVDLHDVIRGSLGLLRRLLREDIQLDVALSPAPIYLRVDPVQVEQVLLNLSVNARDAMPSGGTLRIRTATPQPGRVELLLADTGTGMDATTRERAFEPFFTTKGQGLGTGLGLATVRDIVEEAGGSVSVASTPGAGATFTMVFPTVDHPTGAAATSPASPPPVGRGEVVLVVEDAAEIRALVREVLTESGYRVKLAADGAEAVVLAARDRVDLLLCDVVLPRLSGPDVYARIRRLRPAARVLFMSGYADAAPGGAAIPPGTPHIAKPFKLDTLLRRVREALDA